VKRGRSKSLQSKEEVIVKLEKINSALEDAKKRRPLT